jgi:TRAP transporter 4TM/12TM fusion protein
MALASRLGKLLAVTGEGIRLSHDRGLGKLIAAMSVLLTLIIAWYALYMPVSEHLQISYFLTFILPIGFLTTTISKSFTRLTVVDYLLAVVSFVVGVWYVLNEDKYQNWMIGFSELSPMDVAVGILLVIIVVELCRRATGWGLTSILVLLMLHVLWGPLISGSFHHDPISLQYFLEMQTVGTDGIFGSALYVGASYAFLFVLFGSLYTIAGGGELLFDLAAAATGRMIGGPAKACVFSSALYGSVSGSPVADVATTGPVSIPIMKSIGIPAERAAAIEAAASSGGAMLPPVMGAVAFLMADFTGISYSAIAFAALPAALLYYVGVFVLVHFDAVRFNVGRLPEERIIGVMAALRRGWHNLIPWAVLIWLLIKGYSPAYIGAGAALAVIVSSWLSKTHAIGPRRFLVACIETCRNIVPLAAAVAAAGLMIGCIELTGLSGKFTVLLFGLSGGDVALSLVIAAVILVLIGAGAPTTGTYIMGVALIAPVFVVKFGLPVLGVHMFMLFYACMSAISPPIAVACFTAAAIAEVNPNKIALLTTKLAIGGFVLPFYFVFNPGLLMEGSALQIVTDCALAVVMMLAAIVAIHGWVLQRRVPWWLRLVMAVLAVLIIDPDSLVQYPAAAAAVALCGLLWAMAHIESRKTARVAG